MDITFDIPHAFQNPKSTLDENAHAWSALQHCLSELRKHTRAELRQTGKTQVTFTLPDVFDPTSSAEENAYALRALLDCLTALNSVFLKTHTVPDLYRSRVRYQRTQVWDTIPALYGRGYGDCKSLTAARVAQYRKQGIDCKPVFRWIRRPDGSNATDFHILVQRQAANGAIVFEDPSKNRGMGKNENARP